MKYHSNNNHSISITENLTDYYDNKSSSTSNEFLLIFLDRSQLVMTIIGVIANIGTSITLIKNGQVGTKLDLFCYQNFLYLRQNKKTGFKWIRYYINQGIST